MVKSSSDPLPIITLSGLVPKTSATFFLALVATGSGYNLNFSLTSSFSAAITFADGGYGFSFVLSLMYWPSCGCSPGTYPFILSIFFLK